MVVQDTTFWTAGLSAAPGGESPAPQAPPSIPLESLGNQHSTSTSTAQPTPGAPIHCFFVRYGVVLPSQWLRMSAQDQGRLFTTQAWKDWRQVGRPLRDAIAHGFEPNMFARALSPLLAHPHERQVDILTTCRLAGCDLGHAEVVRFLSESIPSGAGIKALMDAGVSLEPEALRTALAALSLQRNSASPFESPSELQQAPRESVPSLSDTAQAQVSTPKAQSDWNEFGPNLALAIREGFKTFAQKSALERIVAQPYAKQVEYLETCRLGGCALEDPAVTRMLVQSASGCQTISAMIDAGVTLADETISEALSAVAVISTRGQPLAYACKARALNALSKVALARSLAVQDVKSLEVAGNHAKDHGGSAWDASCSRYVVPTTPYNEYGALASLVGVGFRVADFEVGMLNRRVRYPNANPIPYLAEMGTYRTSEARNNNSGSCPAVPIDYAEHLNQAISLALLLGHDVNARSEPYGIGAIHLAACAHSPGGDIIRRLGNAGADIEALAKFGDYMGEMRPLGWALCGALEHADTGTLDALLERGAQPNAADADNKTPLERLVSIPHTWKAPAAGLAAARSLARHGAHFSTQATKDAALTAMEQARKRDPGQAALWDEWAQTLQQLTIAPSAPVSAPAHIGRALT